MWKKLRILGIFILMVICGVVAYAAAMTFLMGLGLKLHDNYEYYGGYPALVIVYGCGTIGFLAPAVIVWYLDKHSWQISLRTLFIATFVVAVIVGIYSLSL